MFAYAWNAQHFCMLPLCAYIFTSFGKFKSTSNRLKGRNVPPAQ